MGFGYGFQSTQGISGKGRNGEKQVFRDTAQCAHVWAQQTQARGRNPKGSVFFEGETIYSYRHSAPMARFLSATVDGARIVLLCECKYSVTTSSHQNDVRRALNGLNVALLRVPDLSEWRGDKAQCRALLLASSYPVRDAETIKAAYGFSFDLERERARIARDAEAEAARQLRASLKSARATRDEASPRRVAAYLAQCAANLAIIRDDREASDKQTRAIGNVDKLRAARLLLSKHGEKRASVEKMRAAEKQIAAFAVQFGELKARLRAELQRANERRALARELRAIRKDVATFAGSNGCLAEYTWKNAIRLEASPRAVKLAFNAWSFVQFIRELRETVDAANPRAYYARVELRRRIDARKRAERVTAETWINGARGSFYQESPTLVRRDGERLQTSRNAEAPFSHAVAIFVKAQHCRFNGVTWKANGERFRAGAFELDSIDARGNIRVGCHTIAFEEMLRLAVREVPHLVKAQFPLPAIIR